MKEISNRIYYNSPLYYALCVGEDYNFYLKRNDYYFLMNGVSLSYYFKYNLWAVVNHSLIINKFFLEGNIKYHAKDYNYFEDNVIHSYRELLNMNLNDVECLCSDHVWVFEEQRKIINNSKKIAIRHYNLKNLIEN